MGIAQALNVIRRKSCQKSKLWREPEKTNEKGNPRVHRPASSFVKRCITSGKASTALAPLNRRLRQACRRRAVPASIFHRRKKVRFHRRLGAAPNVPTRRVRDTNGRQLAAAQEPPSVR